MTMHTTDVLEELMAQENMELERGIQDMQSVTRCDPCSRICAHW